LNIKMQEEIIWKKIKDFMNLKFIMKVKID
jgi:hypothetical protein